MMQNIILSFAYQMFQLYAMVQRDFKEMEVIHYIIEDLNIHIEIEKALSVFVIGRCQLFYDSDK